MTHGNPEFLETLSEWTSTGPKPTSGPAAVEFHVVTIGIPDRHWRPSGPRTRPPQASGWMSHATANRTALLLNLERMHKNPKGVKLWSVVSGHSGSSWFVIDVPIWRWSPKTPHDLPPEVQRLDASNAEFKEWLFRENILAFVRARRWTIVVSPIKRTFRPTASDAAQWLQEADAALFRQDLKPIAERFTGDPTGPETNGQPVADSRLYQVGELNTFGSPIALSRPMPQSEAIDELERSGPGAILIPVRNG